MDTDNPQTRLGQTIKVRRQAHRLSQSDLAQRSGLGEATVRRIESGAGASFRDKTKTELERALSTSDGWVDRVLTGTATAEDLDPTVRHTGTANANLGRLDASVPGPTAVLKQAVSGVGGIPSGEQVGTPSVGSRAPRHVSDLTLAAWLVERLERRYDELKPSEKDLHAAARAALSDLPSRPPQ